MEIVSSTYLYNDYKMNFQGNSMKKGFLLQIQSCVKVGEKIVETIFFK